MRCNSCNEDREEASFAWKKIDVKRQAKCRSCQKEYRREHYLNNKEKYKEKAKRHSVGYIDKNKKWIYTYLSRNPCTDCGFSDMRALEFDHLRDKEYNVCQMYSHSLKAIKKEIAKCEVVCANCHRIRTGMRSDTMRHNFDT